MIEGDSAAGCCPIKRKAVLGLFSSLTSFAEALLLVLAISTDAFAAALAYGTRKIHIPVLSAVTISGICSGILLLSLLLGGIIRPALPDGLTAGLGFAILFLLGFVKLFDSSIKAYIRRHQKLNKRIRFSFCSLKFILTVYADPSEADQDASRVLSPLEAASLAVALSLDGLAAGVGAGFSSFSWLGMLLLSFGISLAAVGGGYVIGRHLAEKSQVDLSWLGGLLLILLAFMKL